MASSLRARQLAALLCVFFPACANSALSGLSVDAGQVQTPAQVSAPALKEDPWEGVLKSEPLWSQFRETPFDSLQAFIRDHSHEAHSISVAILKTSPRPDSPMTEGLIVAAVEGLSATATPDDLPLLDEMLHASVHNSSPWAQSKKPARAILLLDARARLLGQSRASVYADALLDPKLPEKSAYTVTDALRDEPFSLGELRAALPKLKAAAERRELSRTLRDSLLFLVATVTNPSRCFYEGVYGDQDGHVRCLYSGFNRQSRCLTLRPPASCPDSLPQVSHSEPNCGLGRSPVTILHWTGLWTRSPLWPAFEEALVQYAWDLGSDVARHDTRKIRQFIREDGSRARPLYWTIIHGLLEGYGYDSGLLDAALAGLAEVAEPQDALEIESLLLRVDQSQQFDVLDGLARARGESRERVYLEYATDDRITEARREEILEALRTASAFHFLKSQDPDWKRFNLDPGRLAASIALLDAALRRPQDPRYRSDMETLARLIRHPETCELQSPTTSQVRCFYVCLGASDQVQQSRGDQCASTVLRSDLIPSR